MKRFGMLILLLFFLLLNSGCFLNNKPETPNDERTDFKVYYYEDGLNSLRKSVDVVLNEFYELPIPEKEGYNFIGYFDSLSGGTQHVNSLGQSIQKYNIADDLILYGQWTPKTYKIVLDAQGGSVQQSSLKVEYNSELTEINVKAEKKGHIFKGWYELPNGKGRQYTDENGVFLNKITFNPSNFTITDEETILYAHYDLRNYKVVFHLGIEPGSKTIEVDIPYNDNIEDYFPTELVNGQAVISWSQRKSDPQLIDVVTGKVDREYVLYPAEFAPCILFKIGKGEPLKPLAARAGSSIVLPTAKWENNKFIGWFTAEGEQFTSNVMPSTNIILYARYEPIINFENTKGIPVNPLEVKPGMPIKLPILEKEHFSFLGWFTADNQEFTENIMPEEGIKLYAKWKGDPVTITFDSKGGTPVSPIETEYGLIIYQPSNPTKGELVFAGWYTDENYQNPFEFGEVNIVNITLYAKWEEKYVEIRTVEDLKGIFFNMAGNYKLMNDIDLEGLDWVPLGNEEMPFTGILDGQGHLIYNLNIFFEDVYTGFFAYNKGTIKNIGFEAANIRIYHTNGKMGIIAGYNEGTIINSYACGDVVSRGGNHLLLRYCYNVAGGIAGYNKGTINNCYTSVNVQGSNDLNDKATLGGIVGYNDGNINNSISFFTVLGGKDRGAISGDYSGTSTVKNSYRTIGPLSNGLGTLVDVEVAKTERFFVEMLKWDTETWTIENGNLPKLKIQN